MAEEKVTLTLDAAKMAALRRITGPRSLSAEIGHALSAHLQRLRHLAAVDEWLAEMDSAHGPVPAETLEWVSHVIDDWNNTRAPRPDGAPADAAA